MKIISWNCNMAFRKKAEYILKLKPDIVVVPECEHPKRQKIKKSVIEPNDRLWIGENETKGLGVFSYSDYTFQVYKEYSNKFRYVLPIKVKGKEEFKLLAIWAINDAQYSYIEQVWSALNYYKDFIDDKTIIIGDFNSNKIWDSSNRRKIGNHMDVVNFLSEKATYSMYHEYFKEQQGKETQSTLYLYRKKDRPYHIDYCFGSQSFLDKLIKVEIGSYEEWSMHSDHVPISITFKNLFKNGSD